MTRFVILGAVLAMAIYPPRVSAADIAFQEMGEGAEKIRLITIEGEIRQGDDRKFANEALKAESAIVAFSSPGGNLIAGIEIGRAIRLKGFATLTMDGYQCASACALAWLGGGARFMGAGSRIGFHAASRADTGATDPSANAIVGAYLNQLGLPLSAIAYITETLPDDMRWLSREAAEEVGIEVKVILASGEAAPNESDEQVVDNAAKEWIQTFSRPDRNTALQLAKASVSRLGNTRVFQYDNGWYVVVLGPYDVGAAGRARDRLVALGEIPADSLVVRGQRFIAPVNLDESELNQTTAIDAANELFRVWSLPNPQAIQAISSFYLSHIEYYGKRIATSVVMSEKYAFVERWPYRNYRIRAGSASCICDAAGVCSVVGIVDWKAQSPERQAKSEGAARFRFVLARRGTVKILLETSEVLERTVSKGLWPR